MINPTAIPFRFFLLGATGRAGLSFPAQALARVRYAGVATAPYTTVSTGTRSALRAIAAVKPNPMPFISIAAWGLGPNWGLYHRLLCSHVCRYRKDVVLVETSR
jgi:hypothetical protein